MKSIIFMILSTLGCVLVAPAADATNRPRPCAMLRDSCKSTNPASACDKAYQDAVAHNGSWNGPLFDRRMNQGAILVINCIP